MISKEYYVIQNKEGKFFQYDNMSDGYPYFSDNVEHCEKYSTKQEAENFLYTSNYVKEFVNRFISCVIRKVIITITIE